MNATNNPGFCGGPAESGRVTACLSIRYRRLAKEVLSRLPAGWNAGHVICIEETLTAHSRHVYAYTFLLQSRAEHAWLISLYTPNLDELSDKAVCWLLAREFGRVASQVPLRQRLWWRGKGDQRSPQRLAEQKALEWGFAEECRQFECERPNDIPQTKLSA